MSSSSDAVSQDGAPQDPWFQVVVNGSFFSPSPINIIPYASVTFVNRGPNTANISGDGPDGDWSTGDIQPTDSAEQPFGGEGMYYYTNIYESGGTGMVRVAPPNEQVSEG